MVNENEKTSQNSPLRTSTTRVQKVALGYANVSINSISQGNPLIVGEKYSVQILGVGDNFSNVGYVEDGEPFIATATTPLVWTGTTGLFRHNEDINIIINTIDPNMEILSFINDTIEFRVTNNGFVANQTYPDMNTLESVEIVDENTIITQTGEGYFKIEVYD